MNIVTIDFDIIMEPSINLYNDKINDQRTVLDLYNEFNWLPNSIPANLYLYEYLTNYILCCKKANVPIHFIDSHDEIIQYIKNYKLINLINIDHHHDLGYIDEDIHNKIKNLDCGNWAKYGLEQNIIKNYIWVKDKNSIKNKEDIKYKFESYEIKDYNLVNLHKETDELIICSSFEWIPAMYHPLFSVWQDIGEG